jgi:hypothetical protein
MKSRLFACVYPCGIVYADRLREVRGDYARAAFLAYKTLELCLEHDCPRDLRREIVEHAAKIQARRGERYQISTAGQTIILGE